MPAGYRPRGREKFMNPTMKEYFRQKLLRWKDELLRESTETIQHLRQETLHEAAQSLESSPEVTQAGLLRWMSRLSAMRVIGATKRRVGSSLTNAPSRSSRFRLYD